MKFIKIFLLISTVLVFSSCSKKNTSDKKIFNLNIKEGIETLEPVMSNSAFSIWGVQQVMEGLVEFDKEKNIVPCIAKNWTISPDGITYTFNLRSDVKFHDDDCFKDKKGRNVTAGDFKYCLERVNNPKSKTRGLWVFRDKIKGAKEFSEGKANEISGIKAVNDTTLQIELYSAFSPFLSLLTMTYGFVYPKEAVDFYGEKFGFHPVGTGPFKFIRWSIDKELVLDKNLNYWEKDSKGAALPYLDGVKITFSQNSETEYLDFQSGKYDFHQPSSETFDIITDESGKLKDADTKNFTMVKQPWLMTVFLGMMQSPELPGGKTGPFAGNKKLREALNYAIDKDKIVKFVLKNRGKPAVNGPIPPGMPGFNADIKGYTYDLNKAKELLKEAGYGDEKTLKLNLVCGNEEIQRSIAIAIQEQLKSAGIDLQIEQMLHATMISKQENGEFPFWRASWGADYFDPENFMALFYSKNITPKGPNRVGYSNPKVDELYEKSLKTTDNTERMKMYDEIQKIVIEDAVWLPLYYNEQIYLLNKNVEGFYIDGLNIINLKYTVKK